MIPHTFSRNSYVGILLTLFNFAFIKSNDLKVSDKPTTAVYGEIGHVGSPLVVVGGNCSIQGFDFSGNDSFWTVSQYGNHLLNSLMLIVL